MDLSVPFHISQSLEICEIHMLKYVYFLERTKRKYFFLTGYFGYFNLRLDFFGLVD